MHACIDAMSEVEAKPLLAQLTPVQSDREPAVRSADETIWLRLRGIAAAIPRDEMAKLPADGAAEHDHYIYGTPKRANSGAKHSER